MSLLLILALLGTIDGETGTLRIHSQPDAEVVWEGVSLGSTDTGGVLTVSDIPPGTFSLALRKAGFREFQKAVTITGGETTSLQAALEPIGPPAPNQRVPSKVTKPAKRAEPVSSGQDNRLNELLKSEPK